MSFFPYPAGPERAKATEHGPKIEAIARIGARARTCASCGPRDLKLVTDLPDVAFGKAVTNPAEPFYVLRNEQDEPHRFQKGPQREASKPFLRHRRQQSRRIAIRK